MKQVAVVGAGGIGSWLAFFLYNLEKYKQLSSIGFTFFDDDFVEDKNLSYQNFELDDIADLKVESISARYGFDGISTRVENIDDLKDYDCIICAVDSKSFRKNLFENCNDADKPYWIDLRSEGRTFVFYTKHQNNTIEKMLETLPKDDSEEASCQLEWELLEGTIQQGNKIIAAVGSQLLLNWYREQTNPPMLVLNI